MLFTFQPVSSQTSSAHKAELGPSAFSDTITASRRPRQSSEEAASSIDTDGLARNEFGPEGRKDRHRRGPGGLRGQPEEKEGNWNHSMTFDGRVFLSRLKESAAEAL